MSAKRVASKSATPASSSSSPVLNLAILGSAVAYGLWHLVTRGKVSWPPTELLANAYTLAGCLAIVGPVILYRRDGGEGGVGEMLWMTGGVMVWVFNLASLAKGDAHSGAWATPLASRTMGLVMLAVLVAAWRMKSGSRSWAWTNVTGWVLGVFWVGLALATFVPGNPVRLAMR
ncbi:MAG: hypothetical protein JWN86_2400 [Planctomycetota bacterium]|nr:hypothetical protein [Planctomycetota bacterium]